MTPRQVLMIEVDGFTAETAAARIASLLPDAQVWRAVDPVDAALTLIDDHFVAAA